MVKLNKYTTLPSTVHVICIICFLKAKVTFLCESDCYSWCVISLSLSISDYLFWTNSLWKGLRDSYRSVAIWSLDLWPCGLLICGRVVSCSVACGHLVCGRVVSWSVAVWSLDLWPCGLLICGRVVSWSVAVWSLDLWPCGLLICGCVVS